MAICGDGGFMMNSQDLETAIRLGLNLVVLIIEDRGYGMIRWKQESMGFGDFALSFENPDFVKYAEVCVPKTLFVLIGAGNRLTSAHNDRAIIFYPGGRGLAI